jgi:hypothetical protein
MQSSVKLTGSFRHSAMWCLRGEEVDVRLEAVEPVCESLGDFN